MSDTNAIAASREKALASVADSNPRRAVRRYRKHLAQYPEDDLARAEMLSAQVLSSKPGEGKFFIDAFESRSISPGVGARLLTAEAYYKLDCGKLEEGLEGLAMAKEMDPGFGLPYLSLGRYWVNRDPAKARGLLGKAAELMPASVGPLLPMVQVELHEKRFISARRTAQGILSRFPFRPKVALAFLWASVMSMPLKGVPFFLAVSVGIFLPHAVPIIMSIWAVLTLLSLFLLRKTIPQLAILPAADIPALLATILARWLFWGRIYP